MHDRVKALLLAALAALLVGALAVAAAPRVDLAEPPEGAVPVLVLAPGGVVLFDAPVLPAAPTAYAALVAAAEAGGFALVTERYPGMGLYVRAVAGYEARGATGWVYGVERDGEWTNGDRSADRFLVEAGDRLRWAWSDAGAPR